MADPLFPSVAFGVSVASPAATLPMAPRRPESWVLLLADRVAIVAIPLNKFPISGPLAVEVFGLFGVGVG